MGNTKEEILIVALHLFAKEGYEAVSVSQIAGALDMTKGALYRHYKSKRDIFDHIVWRMEQGDSVQAEKYGVPGNDMTNMAGEKLSLDNIVAYSKAMYRYWTEDDFASSFRKMLTLEQFRSEEMQTLYQQYLAAGPVEYVKDLFESIGLKNPEAKATMLYSTMYMYYSLYDGAQDKEKVKAQFENAMNECVKKLNDR